MAWVKSVDYFITMVFTMHGLVARQAIYIALSEVVCPEM